MKYMYAYSFPNAYDSMIAYQQENKLYNTPLFNTKEELLFDVKSFLKWSGNDMLCEHLDDLEKNEELLIAEFIVMPNA